MKKIVFTVAASFMLLLVTAQNSQFGILGGVNYNLGTELIDLNVIENAADDIRYGGENSVGYHLGLWAKYNYTDLFLKGELRYTHYKSTFDGTPFNMTTQKVDVPILLGMKILGPVYVFAGPDFQYVLQEDFSLSNTEVTYNDFTVGLHLGVGVEFGKLSLDMRYEKGLSGRDSEVVNSQIVTDNFTFDSRPNQLLFGLGYSF